MSTEEPSMSKTHPKNIAGLYRSTQLAIRDVVHNNESVLGRLFDIIIMILIIFSLITFTLETLPHISLPYGYRGILEDSEYVISILFTIEYVLRIWTAEKKTDYIFSFYGIVDLLAILPFYLVFLGVDLYAIRALRVLRILKLTRYNSGMLRLGRAFAIAKSEVIVFLLVTLVLLYLAGVGIYLFEHKVQPDNFRSLLDGLWWGVATLTTVGYGDIYPVTTGGRLFTFLVLLIGLGTVAAPAGIIASALTQVDLEEEQERQEEQERKEALERRELLDKISRLEELEELERREVKDRLDRLEKLEEIDRLERLGRKAKEE